MKMDEYISREEVMSVIANMQKEYHYDAANLEDRYVVAHLLEIADKIKDLKAADVQPVDRWISVKDKLPEIGKSVLIYYPKWDGDEIQVAKLEDDGMMFDICGEFNVGTGVITHWMPLPEPPKDGDTE